MIEGRRPGLEPSAELSEVGALVLALLLPCSVASDIWVYPLFITRRLDSTVSRGLSCSEGL